MKVRDLITLLEHNDWSLVRQKGSHRQFRHPANPNVITVPGHLNGDVRKGIENDVKRKAKLKK
jgi:predicted RNA binding protein YcfA (HicA-like mRNA interferase family)